MHSHIKSLKKTSTLAMWDKLLFNFFTCDLSALGYTLHSTLLVMVWMFFVMLVLYSTWFWHSFPSVALNWRFTLYFGSHSCFHALASSQVYIYNDFFGFSSHNLLLSNAGFFSNALYLFSMRASYACVVFLLAGCFLLQRVLVNALCTRPFSWWLCEYLF